MTAQHPIGVFDSGLGGLTIVKALRELLPEETILYFGDTAHLPYGDKSPELIQGYAADITDFLVDKGLKALIIACNTASAVALKTVIAHAGEVPVFDVVRPAARMALEHSRDNRIGVIGTRATIGSKIYTRTLLELDPSSSVIEKPTPLLVPLIEEGWLHNSISREVIEAYMSDTGFYNIDTLILGCTHYPLIKDEIEEYFGNNFSRSVDVIDSSVAVAETVKAYLKEHGLLASNPEPPENRFFASDFSQSFEDSAKLFLKEAVKFEKVVLA